ncbi:MAG: hypothetical protein ISR44_00820 [Rhodospirillales bacterium]|nr:hypothetical protein [Rhodospirillales bacterium]
MPGADDVLFVLMLENALLEKKGQAFEDFFVRAAITLWGADFVPWRPQGPIVGDMKCDGYRNSEKAVFQSYAPEKYEASKFVGKINDNFNGARIWFGEKMQKWVFVHNQKGGLPAEAGMFILDLEKQNPNIKLETWTPEHLVQQLLELSASNLGNLFPTQVKGQSFSKATWEYLAKAAKSEIGVEPQYQLNRLPLDDELDNLDEDDREVRRRLLGYSRWYDPANKIEVFEKLAGLGHGEELVKINAQRLQAADLIQITENHYLPLNKDICQQAAESLMDEFLQELED